MGQLRVRAIGYQRGEVEWSGVERRLVLSLLGFQPQITHQAVLMSEQRDQVNVCSNSNASKGRYLVLTQDGRKHAAHRQLLQGSSPKLWCLVSTGACSLLCFQPSLFLH